MVGKNIFHLIIFCLDVCTIFLNMYIFNAGMNLVAKEFVVCQINKIGVLILSPFAGAGLDNDKLNMHLLLMLYFDLAM